MGPGGPGHGTFKDTRGQEMMLRTLAGGQRILSVLAIPGLVVVTLVTPRAIEAQQTSQRTTQPAAAPRTAAPPSRAATPPATDESMSASSEATPIKQEELDQMLA